MVNVIFSFDTEDFVTPQSDDAAKILAEILTRHGVKGCFCLVGDKTRALVARNRWDVIDVLRKNEIDYHSNTHHYWPRLAYYLKEYNWEDGVNAVIENEIAGIRDIEVITGERPFAYAKTDCHWASQAIYAMRLIGLPVFTSSVFYMPDGNPMWYLGSLNIKYDLGFDRFFSMENPLEKAKMEFDKLLKIRQKKNNGVIVIGAHPCTWVTKVFYDIYNVKRRGILPPKEKWKPAPLKPRKEAKLLFDFFKEFVKYVTELQGVRIITYRELYEIYKENDPVFFPRNEVIPIVEIFNERLSYLIYKKKSFSAAEIFAMVVWCLQWYGKYKKLPLKVPCIKILGPSQEARNNKKGVINNSEFINTCIDVWNEISESYKIPSQIKLNFGPVSPSNFVKVASGALLHIHKNKCVPKKLIFDSDVIIPKDVDGVFERIKLLPLRSYCLPEDYDDRHIKKYAMLQTWTAKPLVGSNFIF